MCLRRGFSLSLFGAIVLLIWYFYCNCNTTLTRLRIMQSQKGKQPQKDNNKSSNYLVCIVYGFGDKNQITLELQLIGVLNWIPFWGVYYQDRAHLKRLKGIFFSFLAFAGEILQFCSIPIKVFTLAKVEILANTWISFVCANRRLSTSSTHNCQLQCPHIIYAQVW